ncbi:MAG: YfiR family protein [Zoogloeaceae bacterium]|jgi:hypothetical protein|nr:YfiR family protein [Zoogloeaceae bacterium]
MRNRPLFSLLTLFVPALVLALACVIVHGPAKAASEADTPGVAAIVAGIIHYTRWPAQRPAIRICLAGHSNEFAKLEQITPVMEKAGRPVDIATLTDIAEATVRCDLVYVGELSVPGINTLMDGIGGKPILSIGEFSNFCSQGGMFCLNLAKAAGEAPFAANLNAIGRSGLRVSPQVLRLSSQLSQAAGK